MTMERRSFLHLGLGAATVAAASTSAWGNSIASERVPLWPEGAPEQVPVGLRESLSERSRRGDVQDRALTGVSAPWLERFQPTQPNGAAIIAIPGGGYRHMAWDKEGLEIAQWFAARGVAGFALAYRLPHDGWKGGADTPLADAQRAVRLIRARASVWGLDPARIAVVGFSAGGHLAANLAALFDRRIHPMRDVIDRVSARPDLSPLSIPRS